MWDRLLRNARAVDALTEHIPSPCVSVCRMQDDGVLCKGCLRTLEEIGLWSAMPDAERKVVWQRVVQRAQAAQGPKA